MPAPNPGPPPEMPPHGSADPNSPDYNPERAKKMDELGPEGWARLTQAWQKWAAAEDAYVTGQVAIGKTPEQIATPWDPNKTYQNIPGEGQVVYKLFNDERNAQIRQDALKEAIRTNHIMYDAKSGLYYRYGNTNTGGPNSWEFIDKNGNYVQPPPGTMERITQAGGGLVTGNRVIGGAKVNGGGYNPNQTGGGGMPGSPNYGGTGSGWDPASLGQFNVDSSTAGVMNELAKQTALQTANQQFQFQREAEAYGKALPMEQYLTDFYGDILGVGFDPASINLNNYFGGAMSGAGPSGYGAGGGLPNNPGPGGTNGLFNNVDNPGYNGGGGPAGSGPYGTTNPNGSLYGEGEYPWNPNGPNGYIGGYPNTGWPGGYPYGSGGTGENYPSPTGPGHNGSGGNYWQAGSGFTPNTRGYAGEGEGNPNQNPHGTEAAANSRNFQPLGVTGDALPNPGLQGWNGDPNAAFGTATSFNRGANQPNPYAAFATAESSRNDAVAPGELSAPNPGNYAATGGLEPPPGMQGWNPELNNSQVVQTGGREPNTYTTGGVRSPYGPYGPATWSSNPGNGAFNYSSLGSPITENGTGGSEGWTRQQATGTGGQGNPIMGLYSPVKYGIPRGGQMSATSRFGPRNQNPYAMQSWIESHGGNDTRLVDPNQNFHGNDPWNPNEGNPTDALIPPDRLPNYGNPNDTVVPPGGRPQEPTNPDPNWPQYGTAGDVVYPPGFSPSQQYGNGEGDIAYAPGYSPSRAQTPIRGVAGTPDSQNPFFSGMSISGPNSFVNGWQVLGGVPGDGIEPTDPTHNPNFNPQTGGPPDVTTGHPGVGGPNGGNPTDPTDNGGGDNVDPNGISYYYIDHNGNVIDRRTGQIVQNVGTTYHTTTPWWDQPGGPGYNPGNPPPGTAPNYSGGGYYQKNNAMDPNNSNSWGLLAPFAARTGADLNANLRNLREILPMAGGEYNRSAANAVNSGWSNVAHARQDQMNNALANIGALTQQNKFNTPVAMSPGSGGDFMSAFNNATRNQNEYNISNQELALKKNESNQGFWGGLFNTIGSLLGHTKTIGNL